MTNYPTKKLGEVIDINFGERITRTNNSGTKYPVYGGGGESFRTDAFNRENEYVVSRFAIAENCVRFVEGKFWLMDSGGTFSIKNDYSDKLDKIFVGNVLLMRQKEIYNCARGGAQKNIGIDFFKKIKIPLPPLEIQKQIVERLDKIVAAQKLNDGLIQKTDELFQSLLHKELNPAGKNWEEDKFINCIEKNPPKIKGIPREKYQNIGKFPIIDQSDKFIVGYTDNEEKVYKIDSPVIIFGDHTRIFKYVDFNFAIGADGTQIIIPNPKKFIQKFFYFLMLNLKINNLGYSRHFKLLKTKKLIIPPLKTQKQIVAKLSAVQDYKTQLLAQKSKLKELFDSALHKSMQN